MLDLGAKYNAPSTGARGERGKTHTKMRVNSLMGGVNKLVETPQTSLCLSIQIQVFRCRLILPS